VEIYEEKQLILWPRERERERERWYYEV